MIDLKKYSWLDSNVLLPDDFHSEEIKKVLDALDKKDYPLFQKNVLAQYYLERLSNEGAKPLQKFDSNWTKEFRSWMKSQAYKKIEAKIINSELGKFTMSGIVIIITGTLVMFFLRAFITEKFVINFSIDAIVGSIALFSMGRNLWFKHKMILRDLHTKDYLYLDIASFVLCFFLKMMMPSVIDLTLIVLFVSYYIQKRRFKKTLLSI